jgi:hypothetical protein
MQDRSIGLVLATGFATFLVVGIAAAEIAGHWLGAPPIVGLPIGAIAGAAATATVAVGLSESLPDRTRRLTAGFAGLSIGFVVGAVAADILLHIGQSSSIAVGAAVGVLYGLWLSSRVQPAA